MRIILEKKSKTGKFGNIKTKVDGITFDSKKEAIRYCRLKEREKVGYITDLKRQVKFELIPKQTNADGETLRKIIYIADFVYKKQDGGVVVEDVKSEATRKDKVYIIKKKLMLFIHGITIKEV